MESIDNKNDDLMPVVQAGSDTPSEPEASGALPVKEDASQKLLGLIKKQSKKVAKTVEAPAKPDAVADTLAEPITVADTLADALAEPITVADTVAEPDTETVPPVAPEVKETVAALAEDFDVSAFAPPVMPPPPTTRNLQKLDPDLHLTLMDIPRFPGLDALGEGRATGTNIKPVSPPAVTDFKCATPCSSNWDQMTGTQQFRICNACNLTVYDFTSMNQNQAQAMVYRREGKQNPIFYRRADGRFLTSDCPLGARKKRIKLLLLVAGVLIVLGVIALSILMPPPPPPVKPAPPPAPTTANTTPASKNVSDPSAKPFGNTINPQSTFSPWHSADLFNTPPGYPSQAPQNQFVSVPKEVLDKYLELKRNDATPPNTPLPDTSASPSGRYVDVPQAVLQEYQQLRQNQPPAANYPTPAPQAAQFAPAAPASTSSPEVAPAAPSGGEIPSSPDSTNPYVKNY